MSRILIRWLSCQILAKGVDPKTRHLVILRDESKLLVEMTEEGEMVSFRTFVGWLSDLEKSAPQPEGVTLDNAGNLYVVSEPNLFYVFKKPSADQ